ncbi:inhibitor of growth protein 1-like [Mytilus californianus]|uniref:inhibitor of growth protein 1-like n=1 Tax=Mytilus californianus TaxID=6549 RepID=UPI00224513BA|nr:inhibitor of growth protein 1-like [Mytilus californianus]
MTMLNQAAVEALCSATYLENYLDTMDNLPDDLQRVVTQMRELDIQCKDILADIDVHHETYKTEPESSPAKRKAMIAMQRALIKCQEIGDEKLMLLACITDHIENRARQLEQDRENLDPNSGRDQEKEEREVIVHPPKQVKQQEDKPEKVPVKRQRRQKTNNDSIIREDIRMDEKDKGPKKKKKRKAKKEQTPTSPIDPPIDPDEPTYCLCNQVSYGEMIGCDNDNCVIEWFHFNCVGLVNKPKGKWFCPNCRGETSKMMRRFDKS